MRFFEFDGTGGDVDKLRLLLNNLVGSASSKKQPAKYNWAAISSLYKGQMSYKKFNAIYNATPAIQGLIKNYNDDGVELKVPGAPDSDQPQTNLDKSKADVNKIAAGAAASQLVQ